MCNIALLTIKSYTKKEKVTIVYEKNCHTFKVTCCTKATHIKVDNKIIGLKIGNYEKSHQS